MTPSMTVYSELRERRGNYQGALYLGKGRPGVIGNTIVGAIFEGASPPRWMTDDEWDKFRAEAPKRKRALLRSLKQLIAAALAKAHHPEEVLK
jgi:hypothetical protein